MFGSLKQLIYPKEFRIEPPNSSLELLNKLDEVVKMETKIKSNNMNSEKEYLKLLADLGTGIWRANLKLQGLNDMDIPKEIKLGLRHLNSVISELNENGIEIKEHDGESYDYGMALNVLAFQPIPNISSDIIIETIKPTIYYNDQIIQRGEVVVGKPEEKVKKGEQE